MSKFPKRPSPFAGRSREFPFPLVGNMSVNDLAAIAHKGDFPIQRAASSSPSHSFERRYAKVGALVRIFSRPRVRSLAKAPPRVRFASEEQRVFRAAQSRAAFSRAATPRRSSET